MPYMAFFSKVGNIFRQPSTWAAASNSSMLQGMRSMSSTKLFIGGISYNTDEFSLREAFSKYGQVVEARIIVDRETGRSRGFGFITFTSGDEASGAMQAMDGQDLHGRRIRVNFATDRGSGFGGRGFGGPGGGFGNAGGYGAPAGGYGGPAGGYGGPAGGYGGNARGGSGSFNNQGNFGGSGGYGGGNNTFGSGYGVAGGVGGSDNFAPSANANDGFDDKFDGNDQLGSGNGHKLEGGFGSENEFGGVEDGKTDNGSDGFDGDNDTDVAKRA